TEQAGDVGAMASDDQDHGEGASGGNGLWRRMTWGEKHKDEERKSSRRRNGSQGNVAPEHQNHNPHYQGAHNGLPADGQENTGACGHTASTLKFQPNGKLMAHKGQHGRQNHPASIAIG